MMILLPLWGIWDMKKQKFAQRFFLCYLFITGMIKIIIVFKFS